MPLHKLRRASNYSAPLSAAYVDDQALTSNSSSSTRTFTGVTVGTAPAAGERKFTVVIFSTTRDNSEGTGAFSISSITLNGTPMNIAAQTAHRVSGGTSLVCIAWLEYNSATTPTFVVTMSPGGQQTNRAYMSCYRLISGPKGIAVRNTYSDTANNLDSFSIAANVGDCIIGSAYATDGGPFTVSYLTEDRDVDVEANDWNISAHLDVIASVTAQAEHFDTGGDPGVSEAGAIVVFKPL